MSAPNLSQPYSLFTNFEFQANIAGPDLDSSYALDYGDNPRVLDTSNTLLQTPHDDSGCIVATFSRSELSDNLMPHANQFLEPSYRQTFATSNTIFGNVTRVSDEKSVFDDLSPWKDQFLNLFYRNNGMPNSEQLNSFVSLVGVKSYAIWNQFERYHCKDNNAANLSAFNSASDDSNDFSSSMMTNGPVFPTTNIIPTLALNMQPSIKNWHDGQTSSTDSTGDKRLLVDAISNEFALNLLPHTQRVRDEEPTCFAPSTVPGNASHVSVDTRSLQPVANSAPHAIEVHTRNTCGTSKPSTPDSDTPTNATPLTNVRMTPALRLAIEERQQQNIRRHQNSVASQFQQQGHRKYPCTVGCEKRFGTYSDLVRHENTISMRNLWYCQDCGDRSRAPEKFLWPRKDKLSKHNASKHNDRLSSGGLWEYKVPSRYLRTIPRKCGFSGCNSTFRKWDHRRHHMLEHFERGDTLVQRNHRPKDDDLGDAEPSSNNNHDDDDDDDDDYRDDNQNNSSNHDDNIDRNDQDDNYDDDDADDDDDDDSENGRCADTGNNHWYHIVSHHASDANQVSERPFVEVLPITSPTTTRSMQPSNTTTSYHFPSTIAISPLQCSQSASNSVGSSQMILSILSKKRINLKGGTGTVHKVEVLVRMSISTNKDERDSGEVRTFAIKSYPKRCRRFYEQEIEAFTRLDGNDNILKCLGSFVCPGITGGSMYNLLLEYADCDLDEYFADVQPPDDAQRTLHLWKQFGGLAEGLQTIHSGSAKKNLGRSKYGYHHDIKPANILIFRHPTKGSQWKLADFGFSKFVESQNGEPHNQIMEGCTRMWSAPECFRNSFDDTPTAVSQKADIWSLGCVISTAATWAVHGYSGVREFEKRSAPNTGIKQHCVMSRFHDGKNILPEVVAWHARLRGNIGTRDHITDKILDLIDDHLLQGNPVSRYDSKQLCKHLDDLLQEDRPVSGDIDTTNVEVSDPHVETKAKSRSRVVSNVETSLPLDDFEEILPRMLVDPAGYKTRINSIYDDGVIPPPAFPTKRYSDLRLAARGAVSRSEREFRDAPSPFHISVSQYHNSDPIASMSFESLFEFSGFFPRSNDLNNKLPYYYPWNRINKSRDIEGPWSSTSSRDMKLPWSPFNISRSAEDRWSPINAQDIEVPWKSAINNSRDIEVPWSSNNRSSHPHNILPEDLDRPAGRNKGQYRVDLERYGNPDNILDWRKRQGFIMDERIELLTSIMDQYLSGRQDRMKAQTVVILTDEMWKTDQVAAVSKLLRDFENSPRRHGSSNNFQINFHRIEDNEKGFVRLIGLEEQFSNWVSVYFADNTHSRVAPVFTNPTSGVVSPWLGILHSSLSQCNAQFTGGYRRGNLARHKSMDHPGFDLTKHWRCVQFPTQRARVRLYKVSKHKPWEHGSQRRRHRWLAHLDLAIRRPNCLSDWYCCTCLKDRDHFPHSCCQGCSEGPKDWYCTNCGNGTKCGNYGHYDCPVCGNCEHGYCPICGTP